MAAEAAISSVVDLLGNLLIQKVKSLRGVEGKVGLLKDELRRMQSFLKDANEKQARDERVRNWISEIRELAQDAEDTIEIFLLNVENMKNRGLLERCTTFPKRMHRLDRIGDEIDSITSRLEDVARSRETYGVKDLGETGESGWRSQVESMRRLCPWQKDEHMVGLDDDVKKLLKESILYKQKKGLSIAVLEGMGGIGKSTLARKIYNHPDVVSGPFECRAWVVVSSEFTPQETIKQLIFQLQRSAQDKQKLLDEMKKLEESMKDKLYVREELKQMLYNQLEGKSYLIVLDDVWETQHLESLITAFPNQQDKASRILVTSRNMIITKYDQYVHQMKLLDADKGWQLLLSNAFINGKCPEELESIGRQILGKCHGLPLAISVVGGLLMETQTKSGWEQVLSQINTYLGRAESRVSSILELSYQNLSPGLKSCFLCLSFFKEDFTIPTKRLINIWDAQGLIQHEGRRNTEEIGRGYLNELINRSMLQIQDLIYGDRVKSCRIHDLVREVCIRKAKEEIGLEIVKQGEEGNNSSEPSHKPRHRVVYGKYLETCLSGQNKHIRSLFLLNVQGGGDCYVTTPSNYWKSYQLLKTLELDGFTFRRLPDSFRLLIGLKCLRIHKNYNANSTLELPSWFVTLKNLEVLDVEQCTIEFPRWTSFEIEMVRQHYFHTWENMECLKYITHSDWIRLSSTLTRGCRLRELGISFKWWIKHQELSKVRASLEKMHTLVRLHLSVSSKLKYRDLGTNGIAIWARTADIAIVIPNHHPNLTKLKLRGVLPKCPAASMFPPNLSHLTLDWSSLEDDPMAELGKLPKLSFLKLKFYFSLFTFHVEIETMQVLGDGFPSLEVLMFVSFWKLKGVVIEEGGMPQLKHLRIRNCPKMETTNMPERINISVE